MYFYGGAGTLKIKLIEIGDQIGKVLFLVSFLRCLSVFHYSLDKYTKINRKTNDLRSLTERRFKV